MSVEYYDAPEVGEIAAKLIKKHYPMLEDSGVRIEYVFRSEIAKSQGKLVYAKARKITGLNAYLVSRLVISEVGGPDEFFVLEVARPAWVNLRPKQKTALVDHELMHFDAVRDEDSQLWMAIRPHDLEEFGVIVKRHGLWSKDLERFITEASGHEQLRLAVEEASK